PLNRLITRVPFDSFPFVAPSGGLPARESYTRVGAIGAYPNPNGTNPSRIAYRRTVEDVTIPAVQASDSPTTRLKNEDTTWIVEDPPVGITLVTACSGVEASRGCRSRTPTAS